LAQGEAAFLVETVLDRELESGERLRTSYPTFPDFSDEHRTELAPSEPDRLATFIDTAPV